MLFVPYWSDSIFWCPASQSAANCSKIFNRTGFQSHQTPAFVPNHHGTFLHISLSLSCAQTPGRKFIWTLPACKRCLAANRKSFKSLVAYFPTFQSPISIYQLQRIFPLRVRNFIPYPKQNISISPSSFLCLSYKRQYGICKFSKCLTWFVFSNLMLKYLSFKTTPYRSAMNLYVEQSSNCSNSYFKNPQSSSVAYGSVWTQKTKQ